MLPGCPDQSETCGAFFILVPAEEKESGSNLKKGKRLPANGPVRPAEPILKGEKYSSAGLIYASGAQEPNEGKENVRENSQTYWRPARGWEKGVSLQQSLLMSLHGR